MINYFFVALANLVNLVIVAYIWIIIARAIISWVSPDPYNPIVRFLYRATEPVLRPVRERLPMEPDDLQPVEPRRHRRVRRPHPRLHRLEPRLSRPLPQRPAQERPILRPIAREGARPEARDRLAVGLDDGRVHPVHGGPRHQPQCVHA